MSKLKEHLKKHKTVYISTGCVILGAIGGAALYSQLRVVNPQVFQKATALFGSTINQTAVQIKIEAPGNSGNIIKDLTTGVIYPSQNSAAKALGVNPNQISRHLQGIQENVSGHLFEKLYDGGSPHILTNN